MYLFTAADLSCVAVEARVKSKNRKADYRRCTIKRAVTLPTVRPTFTDTLDSYFCSAARKFVNPFKILDLRPNMT